MGIARRMCEVCERVLTIDRFVIYMVSSSTIKLDKFSENTICCDCSKMLREQRSDIYKRHEEKKHDVKIGFVYVIRCEHFYKIGVSKDIDKRAWQTDNPFDIEIIKVFPSEDMRFCEGILHKLFNEYHHRGEWFILPESAVDLIYSIEDINLFAKLGSYMV